MDYAEKVLRYLPETIKYGESVKVSSLSKDTEKFVATVKSLMDGRELRLDEWEFSNDFETLKRLKP